MKFCPGCHQRVSVKLARKYSGCHSAICRRTQAALSRSAKTPKKTTKPRLGVYGGVVMPNV